MMEEKLERYLTDECQVKSPVVRSILQEKITRHDDIAEEFETWLETRKYRGGRLEVGGYTAEKIHELAPGLNGIGVYNFLVTLRDNPEEAKRIINEGFKEK